MKACEIPAKGESGRLRAEGDQIKFIDFRLERGNIVGYILEIQSF